MSVMIEKAYLDRMVLKMERDSLNLKAVIDAMGPLKYVFYPRCPCTMDEKNLLIKALSTENTVDGYDDENHTVEAASLDGQLIQWLKENVRANSSSDFEEVHVWNSGREPNSKELKDAHIIEGHDYVVALMKGIPTRMFVWKRKWGLIGSGGEDTVFLSMEMVQVKGLSC